MDNLAENIIAAILSARTLTAEQKEAMLDRFTDDSVSNEELKAMLDTLCTAEIDLRKKENEELLKIRADNSVELEAAKAEYMPEIEKSMAEAAAEEQIIIQEYKQDMHQLEGELDKVEEVIKKNSQEADEMAQIRQSLGIAKNE